MHASETSDNTSGSTHDSQPTEALRPNDRLAACQVYPVWRHVPILDGRQGTVARYARGEHGALLAGVRDEMDGGGEMTRDDALALVLTLILATAIALTILWVLWSIEEVLRDVLAVMEATP